MNKIKKISKTLIGIEGGTVMRDALKAAIEGSDKGSAYIEIQIGTSMVHRISYGNSDDSEYFRNEDLEVLRKFMNS